MAITPLPTPPSRDDPTNFATRADAFLGALPTFATEANAQAVTVNSDAVSSAASAVTASSAAAGATAAANVTKWISGTTYTEGVVVWSPITYLSYRRKITGGGTTDPSSDSTNWAQAAGTGDVSLAGSQTLTNKTIAFASNTLTGVASTTTAQTLTNKTITGTKETKVTISASDVDLSTGNYFSKTIAGTTTFTVSNVATSGSSNSVILDLTNAGAYTINWWSGVKWAGGTAPTLTASGRDTLGFFTYDAGTTWSGFVLGKDMK